jgi:hypothetical protein
MQPVARLSLRRADFSSSGAMSPGRRIHSADPPRSLVMIARMSDSLLDEALHFCNVALLEMCDTPMRSQLRARLGVLERATWSLPLLPATEEQVVGLAKLVLALRDDVMSARTEDERASRSSYSSLFRIGGPMGASVA